MVDEELIGERVGAGLQHTVYEYGTREVIKIPHWWMRLSTTLERKQLELNIAKDYFGDYLPITRIAPYRSSYCYIQERIRGLTPLALSHIDKHKPDISRFLGQNKKLVLEKRLSADLLGGRAYVHALSRHAHNLPILSANIVLDDKGISKLYLLDTDLLRTSPLHITLLREVGFAIVSSIGYQLNKFTMRHYKMF